MDTDSEIPNSFLIEKQKLLTNSLTVITCLENHLSDLLSLERMKIGSDIQNSALCTLSYSKALYVNTMEEALEEKHSIDTFESKVTQILQSSAEEFIDKLQGKQPGCESIEMTPQPGTSDELFLGYGLDDANPMQLQTAKNQGSSTPNSKLQLDKLDKTPQLTAKSSLSMRKPRKKTALKTPSKTPASVKTSSKTKQKGSLSKSCFGRKCLNFSDQNETGLKSPKIKKLRFNLPTDSTSHSSQKLDCLTSKESESVSTPCGLYPMDESRNYNLMSPNDVLHSTPFFKRRKLFERSRKLDAVVPDNLIDISIAEDLSPIHHLFGSSSSKSLGDDQEVIEDRIILDKLSTSVIEMEVSPEESSVTDYVEEDHPFIIDDSDQTPMASLVPPLPNAPLKTRRYSIVKTSPSCRRSLIKDFKCLYVNENSAEESRDSLHDMLPMLHFD